MLRLPRASLPTPKRKRGRPAGRPTFNEPAGRLVIRTKLAIGDYNAARLAHAFKRGATLEPHDLAWLVERMGYEIEGDGTPAELRALVLPACINLLAELGLERTPARGFPQHSRRKIAEHWRIPEARLREGLTRVRRM
jgi:hypothetical protein